MRHTLLIGLLLFMSGMITAQPIIRAGDVGSFAADFAVGGETAGYASGTCITSGDINGDGIDDIIYGVPFAAPNQSQNAGEVHVFFGRKNRQGLERMQVVRFTSLPDVIITGENVADRLGTSVATGDINGDGIDDLIMGAGGYTPPGRSRAGSVFVLFGRQTWPSFYVFAAQRADVQVIGNASTDKLGGHKTHVPATYTAQSVGTCDLNGDGIQDLVCGAPDSNFTKNGINRARAGTVYVFWGQRNWPANTKLDMSVTQASVTIYASHNYSHLGACFASGDLNGDGIQDLAIGEPEGNGPGGSACGMTHVIYGRPNFPANYELDLGFNGQADFLVLGDNQWDQSGYSLDMGDVNNDGLDDLLIGAWRYDPKNGQRDLGGAAYLFLGSTTRGPNAKADLNTTLAWLNFQGSAQQEWLGYRVRIIDFDGDGTKDMVMSAPSMSPNFRQNAGGIYVVRGGRVLPPFFILDFSLPNTADYLFWGDTQGEYIGQSMGVGDVNGDGVGDIISAGDLTAFGNANQLTGRVVVTHGGSFYPTAPARVGSTMTMQLRMPAESGKPYICAASTLGNIGIPIAPGKVVPLDVDPFFLLSAFFPGNGIFRGFNGVLDPTGTAAPRVDIPGTGGLVGATLYYAAVVLDASQPGGVSRVSNRVHTTMVP